MSEHQHQQYFMRHALRLASRGLGNTWPNPAVGALVVKDGNITGRGWTARGGRPHAETIALAQAGEAAKGAELYVTLEPCSHQGKTPPCTRAIIDAGISHVIAACTDPNPLVSGKGFAQLRAAGIAVTTHICDEEAVKLNEGFFSVIERQRPFITLKIATSLDGKIAKEDNTDKWITSEDARKYGHYLRATHDAILTGIGTVLADDPALTCRLPGRENDSPQRIVLDGGLRISTHAKVLPAWIFTTAQAAENKEKANALANAGTRIFIAKTEENYLSLPDILSQLAKEGITRLMVEGGSEITSQFIKQGLADRIYWFRSPDAIGKKGLTALKNNIFPSHYLLLGTRNISKDILEIYNLRR